MDTVKEYETLLQAKVEASAGAQQELGAATQQKEAAKSALVKAALQLHQVRAASALSQHVALASTDRSLRLRHHRRKALSLAGSVWELRLLDDMHGALQHFVAAVEQAAELPLVHEALERRNVFRATMREVNRHLSASLAAETRATADLVRLEQECAAMEQEQERLHKEVQSTEHKLGVLSQKISRASTRVAEVEDQAAGEEALLLASMERAAHAHTALQHLEQELADTERANRQLKLVQLKRRGVTPGTEALALPLPPPILPTRASATAPRRRYRVLDTTSTTPQQ